MQRRICLHAVRPADPDGFVARLAVFFQACPVRGRLQQKEDGSGRSARYRKYKLLREGDGDPVSLQILEGVLVLPGEMIPLHDVIFSYDAGAEGAVATMARRLLGGDDDYILAEPDVRRRLSALGGNPYPRLPRTATCREAVRRCLPWQLYGISWFQFLLLRDRDNRQLVRQLRVKLRRLQSCFVFWKEGLPTDRVRQWQRCFRAEAEELSLLRELDVALRSCQQMQEQTGQDTAALAAAFQTARDREAARFFGQFCLNDHTARLVEFLLWVDGALDWNGPGGPARDYACRRLAGWLSRLDALWDRHLDFRDMDDLHKLRIKVKRVRYVLQTVDILRPPSSLVRRLKGMQDLLGFLHDDYVNASWAERLRPVPGTNPDLERQIDAFRTWQDDAVAGALDGLSGRWQDLREEAANLQLKKPSAYGTMK